MLDLSAKLPHFNVMRPILLALLLSVPAVPVLAQDTEAPGMMERGLRLFMEGLQEEMEPALRDLEDLSRDAQPFLERLQSEFGMALRDLGGLSAYEAPEFLPNGDIIIRRKQALPDGVEPNPDGSIDL